MIPFSLLWGGFSFFWEYQVVHQQNAPAILMLWGIPFVALGVYLIIGRFFVDSFQRSRTVYGITDQRVLIVSGLMSKELKSMPLRTLSEVSLRERRTGSGSIVFGRTNDMYGTRYGTLWPGMRSRVSPEFELIKNVRNVYEILKEAQTRSTRSGG